MILYCIRHGQTLHNAAGRIQGQSDSDLSPLGRRQCQRLAEALAKSSIEMVYSSPLRRALETAKCLGDALGVEVRIDPRLMEIHAGLFQDLCWEEIEQRYPDHAARWKARDPDFRIPGGESRRELMIRAGAVFHEIRAAGHRRAAILAHGGLISGAFKALLEIPAQHNPFSLKNGSISTVAWDDEPRLLTVNATAHLDGLESGDGEF
jgi:probable phosphoglycerate mutase